MPYNRYNAIQVWEPMKPDNHFWAFYYFCLRKGDTVQIIKHEDGTVTFLRYVRKEQ